MIESNKLTNELGITVFEKWFTKWKTSVECDQFIKYLPLKPLHKKSKKVKIFFDVDHLKFVDKLVAGSCMLAVLVDVNKREPEHHNMSLKELFYDAIDKAIIEYYSYVGEDDRKRISGYRMGIVSHLDCQHIPIVDLIACIGTLQIRPEDMKRFDDYMLNKKDFVQRLGIDPQDADEKFLRYVFNLDNNNRDKLFKVIDDADMDVVDLLPKITAWSVFNKAKKPNKINNEIRILAMLIEYLDSRNRIQEGQWLCALLLLLLKDSMRHDFSAAMLALQYYLKRSGVNCILVSQSISKYHLGLCSKQLNPLFKNFNPENYEPDAIYWRWNVPSQFDSYFMKYPLKHTKIYVDDDVISDFEHFKQNLMHLTFNTTIFNRVTQSVTELSDNINGLNIQSIPTKLKNTLQNFSKKYSIDIAILDCNLELKVGYTTRYVKFTEFSTHL